MYVTKATIRDGVGIASVEANGFINGLIACDLATKVGTRPNATPGTKGRTAVVYDIDSTISVALPAICAYTGEVIGAEVPQTVTA
jgi:hypothetical protein